MIKDYLSNKNHLHFIGIGGAGMFPIVEILKNEGYYITGSDNNPTTTTQDLQNMGINIFFEHSKENIKGADLIVYTAAIMENNEELISAKNSNVDVIERSVLLGLLSKRKNNAICISGTHGKTTASSMVSNVLIDSHLDPTIIVGGKSKNLNNKGKLSKSENIVIESCEFKDNFLKLYPDIAIILNIDEDHLDYFKSLENIIDSFKKFAEKATKKVIANGDCKNTLKAISNINKEVITFGLNEGNNFIAKNIKENQDKFFITYDLYKDKKFISKINLSIPGIHNVLNSLACIATCYDMVKDKASIYKSIENFKGVKRRFDILGDVNGAIIADDYAHHPVEIKTTLLAAKKMGFKKIYAIHQPFTYSRTKIFLSEFAEALSIADKVILTEIMGGREENNNEIKSKDLADLIDGSLIISDFNEIANFVIKNAKENELFITMGCGDVNKIANLIIEKTKNKNISI